jgi:hypothetical protein
MVLAGWIINQDGYQMGFENKGTIDITNPDTAICI